MLPFAFVGTKSTANGIRRHLRGWQAGLVLLLVAGSGILLATPRSVEPDGFPEPRFDTVALAAVAAADDELARTAAKGELDVDVRALGRELRAYNEAAAVADDDEFARARERLVDAAAKAGAFGEQLRQLRAYQMLRFLEELRTWQRTGSISDELRALSGDFIDAVIRNRWCKANSRELMVGDRELRVLFKKRWNTIVGADGEPLALTADEERVRLGFLVAHPFINNDALGRSATERMAIERMVAPQRLKTIERLAALDPAYPAELARGVLFYRTGQYQPAADALRRHLEAQPDGSYALRARNYLKAALDQSVVPQM
jgi:hypothetical protein